MNKIEEIKNRFDEQKKAFREEAQKTLLPLIEDIMREHPEVDRIGWRQYVPGFNDGEPCTFSMTDVVYLTKASAAALEGDDEDQENWDYPSTYGEDKSNVLHQKLRALDDLISNPLRSVCQELWGDNAQVQITSDGKITVEEYDCGY